MYSNKNVHFLITFTKGIIFAVLIQNINGQILCS